MLEMQYHLLNWSMLLQTGGQRSQQTDGKAVDVRLTQYMAFYETEFKIISENGVWKKL